MDKQILNTLDTPVLWLRHGQIEWVNTSAKTLLPIDSNLTMWEDALPHFPAGYIYRLHDTSFEGQSGVLVECVPDTSAHLLAQIEQLQNEKTDLERILEASLDEVFVTDANGIAIRVNEIAEQLYGMKRTELIGKSVYELEQQRVFYPSVISMVLKEKRRISVLQTTSSGQTLIATANPVFDENGELTLVVSNAKDITDMRLDSSIVETYPHAEAPTEQTSLVAESPAMKRVLELIHRIAKTDATTLLLGETGVGKNRVANHIHEQSSRAKHSFVHVDCTSIPEALFESELFGYERGAFTGANKNGKPGKVELADEGTLFLDEIGDLPLQLQGKLLDFVQRQTFTRVGGTRPSTVNVRLIVATNRNLEQMVQDGLFRADLYYRLNVIPVIIPPLRERQQDIVPLTKRLLRYFSQMHTVPEIRLTNSALDKLIHYAWPGNIRELENVLERLTITTVSPVISDLDLTQMNLCSITQGSSTAHTGNLQHETRKGPLDTQGPLRQQLEEFERMIYEKASSVHTSTYAIAKALEVSQPTVVRKLKQYGLR